MLSTSHSWDISWSPDTYSRTYSSAHRRLRPRRLSSKEELPAPFSSASSSGHRDRQELRSHLRSFRVHLRFKQIHLRTSKKVHLKSYKVHLRSFKISSEHRFQGAPPRRGAGGGVSFQREKGLDFRCSARLARRALRSRALANAQSNLRALGAWQTSSLTTAESSLKLSKPENIGKHS